MKVISICLVLIVVRKLILIFLRYGLLSVQSENTRLLRRLGADEGAVLRHLKLPGIEPSTLEEEQSGAGVL